jgi:hypothetical protein
MRHFMTIRNFNKQTFINTTIIVGLLLIPSFLAAWGEDEGTLGTNIFWVTFAKIFYVLRFPTHTLLWAIFSNGGVTIYFVGLIINCMFYGLLTERLMSLLKAKAT